MGRIRGGARRADQPARRTACTRRAVQLGAEHAGPVDAAGPITPAPGRPWPTSCRAITNVSTPPARAIAAPTKPTRLERPVIRRAVQLDTEHAGRQAVAARVASSRTAAWSHALQSARLAGNARATRPASMAGATTPSASRHPQAHHERRRVSRRCCASSRTALVGALACTARDGQAERAPRSPAASIEGGAVLAVADRGRSSRPAVFAPVTQLARTTTTEASCVPGAAAVPCAPGGAPADKRTRRLSAAARSGPRDAAAEEATSRLRWPPTIRTGGGQVVRREVAFVVESRLLDVTSYVPSLARRRVAVHGPATACMVWPPPPGERLSGGRRCFCARLSRARPCVAAGRVRAARPRARRSRERQQGRRGPARRPRRRRRGAALRATVAPPALSSAAAGVTPAAALRARRTAWAVARRHRPPLLRSESGGRSGDRRSHESAARRRERAIWSPERSLLDKVTASTGGAGRALAITGAAAPGQRQTHGRPREWSAARRWARGSATTWRAARATSA
jgi:hypothetical protein